MYEYGVLLAKVDILSRFLTVTCFICHQWERPTPPPGQGERGPCSKGGPTLASAAATAQEAHGARACVHRPPTLELPAPGARAHRGQLSPLECAPKARGVQQQLLAGVWMVLGCAGRVSTRVHEAFEVQTELGGRLGRGGLWDQDSHPWRVTF